MATYVVTMKFEVGFPTHCASIVEKRMRDMIAPLLKGSEADTVIVDEARVVSVVEQSERVTCKQCGSKLTKHGYCRAKACLYSEHKQDEALAEAS